MRRIPPLLALLAATLLLMSVAFANGRPTVFYDSHSYDVMGRDLIETIRDWPASNHNKYEAHLKMGDRPVPTDRLVDPQVEGARSPFYGVLLHGAHLFTTIWGLAALQSFLAAWVVYLLWRTLAPKAPSWSYLGMMAAAAAGTSISFYTTFAMPDIFAGIGGAAVVLILTQGDRLKKLEIAGLWAICAYAMAIHKSHWGTGLMVAFGGGLLLWILGLPLQSVMRRTLVVVSAAATAWAAGAAFDHVYQNRTGYKLGHPPFVMARMLADGPGRAYMRQVCGPPAGPVGTMGKPEPYALCKFQANVTDSTDLILWSDRRKPLVYRGLYLGPGVFNIASRPERIQLENEEMRFVIGTLKFDPAGQALASLKDWGRQLVSIQVDDPLRNPAAFLRGRYWPTTILPKLIPNFEACRPPGDCRPPFDASLLAMWHSAVLVGSLLLLAWRLSLKDVREAVFRRGLKTGEQPARVAAVVLLLIAVAVVNAAICGILSGPFARYQSRLIWLLPIGAGLVACGLPMGFGRVLPLARKGWNGIVGLWERVRAQPVIGRFLPPLDGHFTRFCCVGLLGFTVDFGVLTLIVDLGVNKIGGKVLSFSVAVVATWLANRLWTFRGHGGPKRSLAREFGGYLTVQSVGFAANFAVYSAAIYSVPVKSEHLQLLLGSVAGTAAGLVINYLGAKHLVFRRRARAS
jgi:putative flippase GtrA